jgi:peptidoglycan/LPS O-acetylase OafA/YrhL
MKYRKEIDGLRALAVIPVIFFHAGFTTFSGGFVGVDIFFVISGYLITTIIVDEMDKGSFSLFNFYERRARRILPALFFVMLCTLPFAWFWMLPQDLKSFSQSLVAVPLFGSNVLFYLTSGYFDTASELKPLLHTWSLAVEEQYYVLFPVFLILAWKLGKKWIITLLALVSIVSVLAAQWGSATHPSFTFYLLPTRAFEILIGALISLYINHKRSIISVSKSVSQSVSLAGLALILYAIFAFNSKTPSPSLYTLIPTIGAGLILIFSNNQNLVGKLLGGKLLVGVGLISYSAYLWHQPLLALLKYKSLDGLSLELLLILMILILFLSFLSWHYVEKPFRSKGTISKSKIFFFSIFGSLIFISIGLYGHYNIKSEISKETYFNNANTVNVSKKIMLLGDSHAGHLAYGLQHIFGENLVVRSYAGCIPFYNVDRYDSRFVPGECAKNINQQLSEFESDTKYGLIILSTMGPVYLDGTPFKDKDTNVARVTGLGVELIDNKSEKNRWIVFETGMRNTLKKLSLHSNKKIVFVLDVPELGIEDRYCGSPKNSITVFGTKFGIGKEITYEKCKQTRVDFDERNNRYHNLIRTILKDFPNVTLFDPTLLFCDSEWCYGSKDGIKLYRDADHLTEFGSAYVASSLSKIIIDLLNKPEKY